jgi:hypothetical protein
MSFFDGVSIGDLVLSHWQQVHALYQPPLKRQQSQQYQRRALVTDATQLNDDTTTSILLPIGPLSAAAAVDLTATMKERMAQENSRQEKASRNRCIPDSGLKVVFLRYSKSEKGACFALQFGDTNRFGRRISRLSLDWNPGWIFDSD